VLIKGNFVVKKTDVRINHVSAHETTESVGFYVDCRIAALALHYKHWHNSSKDRPVLYWEWHLSVCVSKASKQVLSSRFKCRCNENYIFVICL